MKLTTSVVNVFVQFTNFLLCFPIVVRAFDVILELALQRFKLALQLYKEFGTSNQFSRRHSQEFPQPQINTDGITHRHGIRDGNICFQHQHCILTRCFLDYPHLFNYKPIWYRPVQVEPHCFNLGQFYLPASYRISLKLWKQQRPDLPKLLKARETKFSLLHEAKRFIQSCQCFLQYLGMHRLTYSLD